MRMLELHAAEMQRLGTIATNIELTASTTCLDLQKQLETQDDAMLALLQREDFDQDTFKIIAAKMFDIMHAMKGELNGMLKKRRQGTIARLINGSM